MALSTWRVSALRLSSPRCRRPALLAAPFLFRSSARAAARSSPGRSVGKSSRRSSKPWASSVSVCTFLRCRGHARCIASKSRSGRLPDVKGLQLRSQAISPRSSGAFLLGAADGALCRQDRRRAACQGDRRGIGQLAGLRLQRPFQSRARLVQSDGAPRGRRGSSRDLLQAGLAHPVPARPGHQKVLRRKVSGRFCAPAPSPNTKPRPRRAVTRDGVRIVDDIDIKSFKRADGGASTRALFLEPSSRNC